MLDRSRPLRVLLTLLALIVLAAAAAAEGSFEAAGDLHAPARYRRKLARVLIERALLRAAGLPASRWAVPSRP